MNANITAVVVKLQQQAAAVDVARTTLSETNARALADFHQTQQQLDLCIWGLTRAPGDLEAEQARLTELEKQRAIVLTKQAELEQQIADAPDWRQAGDGRARDREYDRQLTLRQQLQLLREGALLLAPNQRYSRIEDLDTRLQQSKEQIERLRAQLAAHLQQAEALLAEAVTG